MPSRSEAITGLPQACASITTPGIASVPTCGSTRQSSAFIATLWGVMSANVMWLPMSNKLKRVSELEAHHRELVIEGILAIQSGANGYIDWSFQSNVWGWGGSYSDPDFSIHIADKPAIDAGEFARQSVLDGWALSPQNETNDFRSGIAASLNRPI